MKKILLFCCAMLAVLSCGKTQEAEPVRTVKVNVENEITIPSPWGNVPFDYCQPGYIGFATNAGDRSAAKASVVYNGKVSMNVTVSADATKLWCYSRGALYEKQTFMVPSYIAKKTASAKEDLSGMLFCCEVADIGSSSEVSTLARPLTAGLLLDVFDSEGLLAGKAIKSVTVESDSYPLAGNLELSLPREAFNRLYDESRTVTVECTGSGVNSVLVGTASAHATIGITVIPCNFTGKITVAGEGFSFTVPVDTAVPLLAGYENTLSIDAATSQESSGRKKVRIGVLGDSISTFNGVIPAGYSYYYPRSGSDVTSWEKTYWGVLATQYYDGELDVISSWSGSCVAPSSGKSANSCFTYRCKDFVAPDIILLHGGSNDCQAQNGVALGDYDYDSSMGALAIEGNFRQSFIYVVRYLMANYPEAKILVIVGNRVTDAYADSVVEITEHYSLPFVDFRPENVSVFQNLLHPESAGHAYMASKIYEKLEQDEL